MNHAAGFRFLTDVADFDAFNDLVEDLRSDLFDVCHVLQRGVDFPPFHSLSK